MEQGEQRHRTHGGFEPDILLFEGLSVGEEVMPNMRLSAEEVKLLARRLPVMLHGRFHAGSSLLDWVLNRGLNRAGGADPWRRPPRGYSLPTCSATGATGAA